MEQPNNPVFLLAHSLCKDAESGDIQYAYRGNFTQNITNEILELSETNLTKPVDNKSARKKIYFIMVEGLQNITRHQYSDEGGDESSLFLLQKKGDRYYVTTGNVINSNEINELKKKLDIVNSLSSDELREYSKNRLEGGDLSAKGGAGLGLIEMARKSGNKLNYDFRPVNDIYSFFYFNTEVFASKQEEGAEVMQTEKMSLDTIKTLHKVLNDENILLSFVGAFNQDTLLNFLGIIEQKLEITAVSLKVIKIMTEMFQNIVIHGENISNNPNGTLGTFFISEKDDTFVLTSGNYIKTDVGRKVKEKIDALNVMSTDELNDLYKKVMFDRSPDRKTAKGAGLGLIDMCLKSKNRISYSFYPFDEHYSFYTVQVTI